jgi:zinc and cadmium transporter
MITYLLLVVYALLIVLASVAGGLIPLLARLTHQRMQLALSFVAGTMLGVGLLHLVPHALTELESIDRVVGGAMVGFLTMFFVERFFAFHHHDISEDDVALGADHHFEHRHAEHGSLSSPRITSTGAAIGLALHSLADGVALAASVQAETADASAWSLAGLGTFLVVFLHKPFDAMTLGTLMAAGGRSPRARHTANWLFSLLVPLGAALFSLGLGVRSQYASTMLGLGLAFSAGTFLCIASSDLLPELQFHQHDRGKLSVALLLGIAVAWGIGFVEGSHRGHSGHSHSRPANHDH